RPGAGDTSVAARSRRRIAGFRLWLVGVFAASAFCLTGRASTNYVSIIDSAYDPNELAINVGDTVVWIQNDNTEHTVTSDDNLFDSDTLMPSDVYSFTF